MARKKTAPHGAIINQKTAEEKYQRNRYWFYHRRMHFTPIDPALLGLSRRCTWYYEDEVQRLVRSDAAHLVARQAVATVFARAS